MDWAGRLPGQGHTVISFNYDEVCERAASQALRAGTSDEDWLTKPPEKLGMPSRDNQSRLLKLHGSCLWRLPEDASPATRNSIQTKQDHKDLIAAFTDPSRGYEAAIGVPGPEKIAMASGRFAGQWKTAEMRLKRGHTIVFIGYSMPKTDNDAKRRILHAIRDNKNHYLSIHIVLGALGTDGTAARLVGMLEWALKSQGREVHYIEAEVRAEREAGESRDEERGSRDLTYEQFTDFEPRRALVQVHKLYAEDFLTVVDLKRLDPFADWNERIERVRFR